MSVCDECPLRILHYLDNALQGEDLAEFRAHLEYCSNCRASLEAERSLSQLLLRSRPLSSAPRALHARVAAALEQHAVPARARAGFYRRATRALEGGLTDPAPRVAKRRLLAVSVAVILEGNLSLELHSNSPEQVWTWLAGKVPFPFRLPRAEVTPDSLLAYRLTGATLVKYRGKPAALVTYQKQNEKISLMVASADSAEVAGGEEVRSGKLIFHYRTNQGFNVVTWSNHGLSYALVSSVSGPARESCMVCHQSMADRRNFSPGP